MNHVLRSPIFCCAVAAVLVTSTACIQPQTGKDATPVLSGPYLGQTPPGPEPELFAPGFICTGLNERDVAITPDGNELYFSVFLEAAESFTFAIMVTRQESGVWTPPRTASFSGFCSDVEPCLSADGNRLIFVSNRPPEPGGEPLGLDVNLWVVDRTDNGWSEARPLGPQINTPTMEAFPSLTAEDTLYFTRNDAAFTRSDIYRSRLISGSYQEPEKLPEIINAAENPFNAFIAPDESFLIFCAFGTEGSFGASDYLISFRSDDDTWSAPRNLGGKINSPGKETSAWLSRDGRFLFFATDRCDLVGEGYFSRPAAFSDRPMTYQDFVAHSASPGNCNQDIYWMDAGFLQDFREGARTAASHPWAQAGWGSSPAPRTASRRMRPCPGHRSVESAGAPISEDRGRVPGRECALPSLPSS